MMGRYTIADVPKEGLVGKRVALLGYGAMGRSWGRILLAEGVNIVIGARVNGPSYKQAQEDGHHVLTLSEAVTDADVVLLLLPDDALPQVFQEHIAPFLKENALLGFAHGFAITYKTLQIPAGVESFLVAPKAAGPAVWTAYAEKRALPMLVGATAPVAEGIALSVAQALGGFSQNAATDDSYETAENVPHVYKTTFRAETHTDLFGEQVVLCGGLPRLVRMATETLVEAGYPAELARYECLYEVKIIVDLLLAGGDDYLMKVASTTAAYGGQTRGARIVPESTKQQMKSILQEIQSGQFASELQARTGTSPSPE